MMAAARRIWLVGGLLLALGVACQEATPRHGANGTAPAGSPLLVCPTEVLLGEKTIGDHVDGVFVVANQGEGPLEVQQFRKTCNCGQVEVEEGGTFYPADRVMVPAGQSRRLRMRLAVVGHAGGQSRQRLEFATNDPKQPQVAVEFLVERVLGTVSATPDRWTFGKVLQGTPLSATFEVRDPAEFPRKVDKIEASHPQISVTRSEVAGDLKRSAAGVPILRLEVSVDTTKTGPIDGAVLVRVPDEGRQPLQIVVEGWVVPAVRPLPGELFLPRRTTNGKLYTVEVYLETFAGKIEEITIKSTPAGVTVRLPESLEGAATLTVTLDPDSFATTAAEADRTVRLAARVADVWHELAIPLTHVP